MRGVLPRLFKLLELLPLHPLQLRHVGLEVTYSTVPGFDLALEGLLVVEAVQELLLKLQLDLAELCDVRDLVAGLGHEVVG